MRRNSILKKILSKVVNTANSSSATVKYLHRLFSFRRNSKFGTVLSKVVNTANSSNWQQFVYKWQRLQISCKFPTKRVMSVGEGDPNVGAAKRLCFALQSEDKKARKQALVEFERFLSNTESFTEQDYHDIFKECHIHLLNTLRDKSEPVREQSIKFMTFFIVDVLPQNDYYLSYLFPVLVERVGTVELIEESEEIRLQVVQFLASVLKKYSLDGQLKPFLNDVVTILKQTVQDRYPAIKELSCRCIVELAKILPRDFHTKAAELVKPVLGAFGHQRHKIRTEAISCIGEVILHCDYKSLEEVTGPMAERLFDSIPSVRRMVSRVAARWLMEYRDRYSFFYKLLPLILTGLNDEIEETRLEANELWSKVGLQYQQENEKDLKDQMDYLTQQPEYYPANLTRPNLGCRVLVQRSIGKLTAALARELVSWQADVRVRCSQLLCSVAHHAEEGLTQHLQELLVGMYTAARDEDTCVVENIVRAGELMATFVPVETWKKLVLPAIEDGAHYGHLRILAAFVRGAPQKYVASSLREIGQLLADPDICYSRKMMYQRELITCTKAIQTKYSTELSTDIGQYLFNVIVVVVSVRDPDNSHLGFDLLEELRETLQVESTDVLWRRFVGKLLESVRKDPRSWTEFTFERCIFDTILFKSGVAFGENLITIGEILSEALDIEVEPESRLQTFIALSAALDDKDTIFRNAENLQGFLEKLVTKVLVPSLVWHAGRTAEAMRTMAASCLCSALSPGVEVDIFGCKEVLRPIFDKLLPLLLSLIEDASYKSRMLAMNNIVLLKDYLVRHGIWETDDLIKIYPEIVKRLDDPTDKVRLCAIRSLGLLLRATPEEFQRETYKAHHEFLLDTLLVHFDDDDTTFQDLVFEVIKITAEFARKTTIEKVERHKPLLRNGEGCGELLKYLTED